MKMDTALNIIWDKRYQTDNNYFVQTICVNKYGDESFLVGADLTTGPPDWYQKLVFLKTNNNGDSIAMTYFTQGDPYTARLKALTYIDNHFKIYTTGFGAFIPYYYGGLAIIDFDTCFNIMGYSGIPHSISSYNYIENLNDSVYLLAGHTIIAGTGNSWDLAIAKYNLDNEDLGFNHYNYSQQAREYPGWLKCLSVANGNSIYVGGWTNGDGYFICPYLDQVIVLVNYDSALNMRWARFYGGNACYLSSIVQATTDGGCIIGGMYYDPSNPDNLQDALIIKVDSLGLVTDVPGTATISSHDVILYPNPFHDYFVIQSGPQIAGAWFRMYDVTGCLIIERKINDTYLQQDMTGSPSGIYIWQVIKDGKLIENGNLIKN
ncbi:MAG TPA: T9SS type A sorting domain-containing protein [Paludibacteraceae bacterium]|nr:T9SS type A sorting domain-containing protein [Paludibacteraceae bacterium]